MAAETQYTTNTGMQTISTANSNLDGTGTLSSAIVTGASNGTLIKTVTIKAQTNTTQGMVRLYVYDGSSLTRLLLEIQIPAVTKSSTDPAFEITVPLYYALESGWQLKASTEKAETFNVIAEGQNWAYYTTSVRSETTQYTANTSVVAVATANANLDGTGTLGTVLTASGNGTEIFSISIKATVTSSSGMVRIFLYDGSNTKLLKEVPVSAVTQSSTASTFYQKINFPNGFALKSGWSIKASTQVAQNFNVLAEGVNLSYPA